jgi:hypothetical protein
MAHAALDFAVTHPRQASRWHSSSNVLALLEAPDELALCWLCSEAERRGVLCVPFSEPDLGYALTAVAIEPAGWRLARKYPLALQGVSHAQDQDQDSTRHR